MALFGRQLNAAVRRFASAAPSSDGHESFKCSDLKVIHASGSQLRPKPGPGAVLKFGHTFSDHMFEVDYCETNGWGKPVISPLHDFVIHPAAKVTTKFSKTLYCTT
ncbi:unnamed protein product [Anisakis simplex]|uniref:Branched-chain-amino-acid transaminase n=1 Tax=Anisakis simplex TaxID=6269 RepID=A0A0M3JCK2_ANISI|nr:unnamed protein product [Anisakis simplex]